MLEVVYKKDYLKMDLNNIQSQVTEELLSKLDDEHKEMFGIYLDKIPMLKRLTASNRKRAKDLERKDYKYVVRDTEDKPIVPLQYKIENKIIVDITNPHILEDMDYFRSAALHFKKHGCYTLLHPNKNPQSEYAKFWIEEHRRCLEGLVRPSDGEWISGYNYFYWNYSPIMRTVKIAESTDTGKTRSERIYDFADIWDSDYWYFHYIEQGEQSGQYGKVLKTRGRGYSFKGGSMDARNALHIEKSKSYSMAFEKEYLNKDGIFNKAIETLDWCAQHTPWARVRIKNSIPNLHVKLGYKDSELNIEKGQLSEIIGVTFKDNADKARGKRGKIIKWEEDGVFPVLKPAWNTARMSLEDGDNVFGYMISFGTGGTVGADFEASEEFFYRPTGYNILALDNVFDENASGTCGFFVAEYMNRSNCYDENGNSDVIKALVQILFNRQTVKHGSSDPNTIVRECADRPITPQEAVMRMEGSYFPVYELKKHLSELRTNSKLTSGTWIGRMEQTAGGKVEFKVTTSVKVIDKFPHSDQKPGAIQIFEHPVYDKDNTIPKFRYIAGNDNVDDDGSQTSSLLSTFIMNTLTGKIVAEYTGRPQITEEYFEELRLLLIYYNATLNYENNKKGLYTYFNNKNSLYLLCETPETLRDVSNITISKVGNKRFGTTASTPVNNHGLARTKKWLLEKAYHQPENVEEEIRNLHTIQSPAFVEELIDYHNKGNFDRISAFGMLMIIYDEYYKTIINQTTPKQNPIANDPFWFKNMKKQDTNSYMPENITRLFNKN